MSAVSLVVETFFGEHPETGWIESFAILVSVAIIVNISYFLLPTSYFLLPTSYFLRLTGRHHRQRLRRH